MLLAQNVSSVLLGASRRSKRLLAMSADVVLCMVAVVVSFSVRLGYWQFLNEPMVLMIAVEIALFLPIFFAAGIYANLFRFHGARGMIQISLACALLLAPNVIVFGLIAYPGVPRTVSILFPLVFFALVALSRIVTRYFLVDLFGNVGAKRSVLIFGAGAAGRKLASSLAYEREYRLVAYIDDDPVLGRSKLEGIPIHSSDELEYVIRRDGIEIVFLAIPTMPRARRAQLVERLQAAGVHVLTLPGVTEIVDGKVSVSDLREIDVTDLLSRDPVRSDPELMRQSIAGKIVLVTGAGGSIGSELARQIVAQRPERLILVEMTEAALYQIDTELRGLARQLVLEVDIIPELASIDKKGSVHRIFGRYRPHTIYHAAAYKHVPMVEVNVVSGVANNLRGTLNCALAACEIGAERFILVSTDKAVRPTNVMGASKRICEMVLQALSTQDCPTIFSMVRFGNVLGSSGSVVPKFRAQIAAGGPVSITHPEITRYFMTIPEAAELVIQAGAMAEGGEVYLLEMGEPVKIIDLARTMIRLSGRTVRDGENPEGDIAIVETGLRPGEKLYEELLIGAKAQPTQHARIFQAREDHPSWDELEEQLVEIDRLVRMGDSSAIRAKLRELVSGYTPREAP